MVTSHAVFLTAGISNGKLVVTPTNDVAYRQTVARGMANDRWSSDNVANRNKLYGCTVSF
jgi:hypothetical protein